RKVLNARRAKGRKRLSK
ncbi:MAG: 50S ribosomal protein L34, partial [Shewanella sp.]